MNEHCTWQPQVEKIVERLDRSLYVDFVSDRVDLLNGGLNIAVAYLMLAARTIMPIFLRHSIFGLSTTTAMGDRLLSTRCSKNGRHGVTAAKRIHHCEDHKELKEGLQQTVRDRNHGKISTLFNYLFDLSNTKGKSEPTGQP